MQAPHEAHGATWRWNSEAASFTPASLAVVEMEVDGNSAPGASTSTAAEPAAAAAGGAFGVRGKEVRVALHSVATQQEHGALYAALSGHGIQEVAL